MPVDPKELQEAKELADIALSEMEPGPWEFQRWPCESMEQALDWLKKTIEKGSGFQLWAVGTPGDECKTICITGNGPKSEHHARIITALPSLLQALREAEAERDEARAEAIEQARLNGMGSEREAKLMSALAKAQEDIARKDARIISAEDALVNGGMDYGDIGGQIRKLLSDLTEWQNRELEAIIRIKELEGSLADKTVKNTALSHRLEWTCTALGEANERIKELEERLAKAGGGGK